MNIRFSHTAATTDVVGSSAAVQREVHALIVNAPGARAYSIVSMTYLLVYRNQRDKTKSRELTRFIHWAMGLGQLMAITLLSTPLPRTVVAANQKNLKTVR